MMEKLFGAILLKKCIDLLNKNGVLCYLVPSIWLKPDKQKL